MLPAVSLPGVPVCQVAIKKCPNAFEDLVDAKRIVREIRLLMHFRHENIVKVSGGSVSIPGRAVRSASTG